MRSLGDDCIEVSTETTADAQRLARSLRQSSAFLDVVVGINCIAVRYDAARMSRQQAETDLQDGIQAVGKSENVRADELLLPVSYGGADGPDLDRVCEQLNMSGDEFVSQHTSIAHPVEMLGFTPGFAYLAPMGAAYDVARLATPRSRIAAGSVGFAGGRTGLYALPGPGGWPLIGRTDVQLFDRNSADPFVVKAGMQIRFTSAQ